MPIPGVFTQWLPGVTLAVGISALALAGQAAQALLFGVAPVDALVIAIGLGTIFHTVVGLHRRFEAGIRFASRTVLEIAIVLLGGTISATVVLQAGPTVIAVVALVVALALVASYLVSRLLGLDGRLASLVACGNSICGNSAIMAAAPVIRAEPGDVASSIAFTAALGIAVVLLLPLVMQVIGLSQWQYGVIAGLSVYAVPQVLAATVPVGALSTQVGTLIKLMRVLMLGPVVLALGLLNGRRTGGTLSFSVLVPWFIIGFLLMMSARTLDLLPDAILPPLHHVSGALTLVSMAALGLSVDLRSVLASGGRVLAAGFISILILIGLAVCAALALA